jgi:hypothetical protein
MVVTITNSPALFVIVNYMKIKEMNPQAARSMRLDELGFGKNQEKIKKKSIKIKKIIKS